MSAERQPPHLHSCRHQRIGQLARSPRPSEAVSDSTIHKACGKIQPELEGL